MDWTEVDSSPVGETTYTFQLSIPSNQDVPIDYIGAVVEKDNPNFNGKRGASTTALARCFMSPSEGMHCTPDGTAENELLQEYEDGIITSIEMKRVFEEESDSDLTTGYTQDCSVNDCTFDSSGYGYDGDGTYADLGSGYTSPQYQDNNVGYGYGYATGRASDTVSTGTGYGYDSGTLVFEFDITIDASQLETGTTYWISGLVETRSSTVGHFSTLDQEITPSTSSSGSPGGGGGGGAADGIITAGLGQAFDVSANQRVKILLENELDNFRDLLVKFNQECNGCSIHVSSHGGGPPSGTPAVDSSFRAIEYFSIEVQDEDGNVLEGYIDDGSIEFDVPRGQLDNEGPGQVILKHRTQGAWTSEETRLTSEEDADPLEYNGTFGGFSVFAKAVDTQPPTVSNHAPTGSTSAVTPTISADFSDNRGINPNTFVLRINQREQSGQSGSLDVSEDGFSFVPASELSQGEHDVFVSIQDDSGLETTREWTFRVSEVTCPEPPRITQVQPSEGATDVPVDTTVRVTVQQGSCEIASSVVRVNGQEVSSTLSGGTLTAELSDLGFEEQVSVTAIVTDAGENTARKNWQFTTEQEGDTTEPPTEEDGNALVWIIIALVVLAIIGVGAYFYTQQEGGGPGGPPGGP